MPNTGDGTGWTETSPQDTDPKEDGAMEIRDLRRGVRVRTEKEHTTFESDSAGGEHKKGSAKVYKQDSDPSERPDGTTVLGSDDEGRLLVRTDQNNKLRVWDGSSWVDVVAVPVSLKLKIGNRVTISQSDLASSGGWNNGTGVPQFVSVTIFHDGSAGPIFTLEYQNAGGSFSTYSRTKIDSPTGRAEMSCMVEPNGAVRVTKSPGSMSSSEIDVAVRQPLEVEPS